MIKRIKREMWLICLMVILLITPFSYAEAWDSYDSKLEDNRPGFPVYKESECIGPVINGVCHGGVIDADRQIVCMPFSVLTLGPPVFDPS